MKILILIICCLTLLPLTANAYQTRNAQGVIVDSESDYVARDAYGVQVDSKSDYTARDAYGVQVNSKSDYTARDAYGVQVRHEAEKAPDMIDPPPFVRSSDEEPGWGEEDQDE
jgi:hypothetical protein